VSSFLREVYIFCLLCIVFLIFYTVQALATGPVYTHPQPVQEEFRVLYTEKAEARTSPKIFTSTAVPSIAPEKTGDIFINTSTSKVYIATATASSGSWAILN